MFARQHLVLEKSDADFIMDYRAQVERGGVPASQDVTQAEADVNLKKMIHWMEQPMGFRVQCLLATLLYTSALRTLEKEFFLNFRSLLFDRPDDLTAAEEETLFLLIIGMPLDAEQMDQLKFILRLRLQRSGSSQATVRPDIVYWMVACLRTPQQRITMYNGLKRAGWTPGPWYSSQLQQFLFTDDQCAVINRFIYQVAAAHPNLENNQSNGNTNRTGDWKLPWTLRTRINELTLNAQVALWELALVVEHGGSVDLGRLLDPSIVEDDGPDVNIKADAPTGGHTTRFE
ncbi:hypothetical protein FRB94_002297 [Tulasnella sp. JGI-2019a]|nr:hypothetical protein FRB93_004437 [Tulasnella sp. JGI-2019a]KAG9004556.1 hypothetical protein FRB94_002297 [Tulasnella sp. JGI-2019a]